MLLACTKKANIIKPMILLKQMIVLAIIMGMGFFLAKKDILDKATSKKISWIVVNLCNPALMIKAALSEDRLEESVLLQTVKITLLFYLFLLIFGALLPYILRDKKNKIYSMMIVFGNVGFMGYPLLQAMYGSRAVLLASIFNLCYGILMYTYGVMVLSGEKFSLKSLRMLLNSGIIAGILELIIYLNNIKLPTFVGDTVSMISELTAPLSMMVIGATFVDLSLKKLLTDARIMVFTFIRLIILPLLMFPVFKMFISDEILLGVCLVMVAVPVGSMNVMMAQQYGGDVETSSKGVAISTLLSVVTMPLLFMLLMK